MRFHQGLMRGTAYVVLVCFLSMTTLQAQAAAQQAINKSTPINVAPAVASLGDVLKGLHQDIQRTQRQVNVAQQAETGVGGLWQRLKDSTTNSGPAAARHTGALAILNREAHVTELENQTRQTFQQTEAHLKQARLPDTILQRHYAAVRQFEARSQQLHSKFAALRLADAKDDDTGRQQGLSDIDNLITQWSPKERRVDPNHLPWGSPSNKVRKPYTNSNDYLQHLTMFGIKPIQLAYNGSGALPPGTIWPTLPTMGEAVLPADTQANEDAQITPAIQALAQQLNYNPVLIYQWVKNNIRYIPTYGSIQGSDYTLQLQAGNDFDTASLLIALLRASNVPARYVYGTINVPAAQLDNWVGNVSNPDAAQNLLGQGGVPNVALTQGGQTISVQMEHVWVEAFVNYVPSRGWVNHRDGTGDTWVPLDASYKQYVYAAPTVNIQQAVPFNAQGMLADAQNGATVTPDGSSIQNLNQTAIQADISNYQTQLQNYLNQQQSASATSFLGTQSIKAYKAKVLPSVLQTPLVAVAGDFDTLPDTMRSYFVVQMYQDDTEQQSSQQLGQNPAFYAKISTPSLAGQQLALSFNPTTAADEATVESYLPQPGENGQINSSQLPSGLPGYAINVTPQLTVNGQVIISSDTFSFGQPITVSLGFQSPNNSQPLANKSINAGAYYAIGLDMQGISQRQITQIQTNLQSVQAALQSNNAAQYGLLTKDAVVGNMLAANVNSYFAANDQQDNQAANQSQVVANRYMSFGSFASNLAPNMAYGVPMAVSFSGAMMDIDRLQRIVTDVNNNAVNTANFVLAQGSRESLNEELIPEELFQTPNSTTPSVQGVSAVTALQLAASQGQQIFLVNQQNISTILPQLSQPSTVISDIENSVNAGEVAIVSQSTINSNGWIGSGYIIANPQTGTSAYLIAGGSNGALILFAGALAAAGLAAVIDATALAAAVASEGALALVSAELMATMTEVATAISVGLVTAGFLDLAGDYDGCKDAVYATLGVATALVSTNLILGIFTSVIIGAISKYLTPLAGVCNPPGSPPQG